jgi:hypothetical protein
MLLFVKVAHFLKHTVLLSELKSYSLALKYTILNIYVFINVLFVASLASTIKTCREVCNYLVSIKYLKLDRTTNHFKNSSERYKNKNYKVILT